ncbi:MAG: hypothetical protein ACRELV_00290 [Longimicrobiales bacterium]
MKRLVLLTIASMTIALTGCGQGEVAVIARLVSPGTGGAADTVALESLPVRLLPYDRDAIFDSLSAAYAEEEPQIPDSLIALQQQIAEAQATWQQAELEWAQVRDTLQAMSERLSSLSRASAEYRVLFNEFSDVEPREAQLNQQREAAFARFTELQSRLSQSSQEITALRAQWSDEAFASVDSIIEVRLEELGLEEHADTTSSAGVATFNVPAGQWWVYARYELPYTELYWNVPVEVPAGESTVRLSRENAEERPKL